MCVLLCSNSLWFLMKMLKRQPFWGSAQSFQSIDAVCWSSMLASWRVPMPPQPINLVWVWVVFYGFSPVFYPRPFQVVANFHCEFSIQDCCTVGFTVFLSLLVLFYFMLLQMIWNFPIVVSFFLLIKISTINNEKNLPTPTSLHMQVSKVHLQCII